MYGNLRINELKTYCNYDYKSFGNFTNLASRNEEDEELLLSWALTVDVVGALLLAAAAAAAAICRRAGSLSSRSLVCCTCCLSSCNCCWSNWSCDCIGMGAWGCWACLRTPDSWDRSSAIGSMLSRAEVEEEEEEEERPLPPDPPKCILVARGLGGLGILPLTAGWNKRLTCLTGGGSPRSS